MPGFVGYLIAAFASAAINFVIGGQNRPAGAERPDVSEIKFPNSSRGQRLRVLHGTRYAQAPFVPEWRNVRFRPIYRSGGKKG